jgi:hypothetical protein
LKDVSVLSLGGAPVLGGPDAKTAYDVIIKVPNSKSRH